MTQAIWEQLRKLIADRIGFTVRQQDIKYFKLKIEDRIRQLKLANLIEYYNLLKNSTQKNKSSLFKQTLAQKEWIILANIITNGESFFFRGRGQFDLIANTILPKIIAEKIRAKKQGESNFLSLKIWSAGCSTGEEVYSLAMVINELIADPAQWNIAIIGTDINQDFLESARKGIYKQWSFRLTDSLFKSKYFIKEKDYWQIKPHLKTMVNFYQDNLMDVNKVSHHNYSIDFVLCRNVFIYFDLDSIAKAVQKITNTLRSGAYFMSGHAELQGIKLKDFQPISFPESVVYQYLPQLESVTLSVEDFDLVNNYASPNNIVKPQLLIQKSNDLILKVPDTETSNLKPTEKEKTTTDKQPNYSIVIDRMHILLDKGDYDAIIKQGKDFIENNCYGKELFYLIAQAYANKGNLEKAKQNCDRALEIDYTYIAPLFLLSQIAEAEDNYSKVKELLKKIIYLEPLSIAAYLDLADIYSKDNEVSRSKKMYRTAYDILNQSPQQQYIEYQGKKRVCDLIAYVKHKL